MALVVALLPAICLADVTATITSVADTGIRDATNTYGSDPFMYIYGSPYHMGYVRFDLNPLSVYSVLDAQLVMTVSGGAPRNDTLTTGRFAPYGLNNIAGNTPQDWDEATLNRSNTGLEVDWATDGGAMDFGRITNLDADDGVGTTETLVTAPDGGWAAGTTITLTGQPLVDFLQSRVDDNGLVTFIIRQRDAGGRGYGLATKENATVEYWPRLEITYVPGGAVDPQPADGSTIIDLNLSQLCWKNINSERAVVWFGQADVNELDYQSRLDLLAVIDEPDDETCLAIPSEMLPLASPATYTWAVESWTYPDDPNYIGDPNVLMSIRVWQFHTTTIPVILTQPEDQYVFPGETAVFTTEVESQSPLSDIIWYKDDVAIDPAGPDIDVVVEYLEGTRYSVSLVISNVTASDEGLYHCAIRNAGEAFSLTESAYLIVKRKLAHWKLDGNADDETGVYNGTLFGEPNFVQDGDHYAMEFDGVDDYILLPEGFSNFNSGLTFTVWAKPTAVTNWARFFDFGNGAGVDNVFVTRNGTSTNLTFNTYNGLVTATGALALDEWQFFAVTMTETGNVTIYKNGFDIQTGTVGLPAVTTRTLNYIGQSNWEADALYQGLMDDIRIYNYPLDADTLATMYSDVAGRYCRVRPELDLSGNCIVDISDFAILALSWLDCGYWPDCDL